MTYLHHVPGRLRVRAAGVRGDARRGALRKDLESLDGVENVEINPVTGSALIHYRVGATDGDRLVTLMRARGWLSAPSKTAPRPIGKTLANAIVRQVAETALERGLVALGAALL